MAKKSVGTRVGLAIVAILLGAHAGKAYGRVEFVVRHAGERVSGAQVCFWPAKRDDGFFAKFLSSHDVRCVPADQIISIPEGNWNVFGRHGDAYVSYHPDFAVHLGTGPGDPYQRTAIELVPAGVLDAAEVNGLGDGEWLAVYCPNAKHAESPAVIRPFPASERELPVPADETVLPLVVRDSTIVRIAAPITVKAGERVKLPPLESWPKTQDLVALVRIASPIPDALPTDAPKLTLDTANGPLLPLIPPRHGLALDRSLAIFRDVPQGKHDVRISGELWRDHALAAEVGVRVGVTTVGGVLLAEPAGALEVAWSIGPLASMTEQGACTADTKVDVESLKGTLRLVKCAPATNANDVPQCATVQERLLENASGSFVFTSLEPGRYELQLATTELSASAKADVVAAVRTTNSVELAAKTISGRVKFRNVPATATVRLRNSYGAARTDSAGAFQAAVTSVPVQGIVEVRLCDPPLVYEFLPPSAIESYLDIEIPDNELTVRVVDEKGRGLAGAKVGGGPLFEEGDAEYSFLNFAPTDSEGNTRVGPVAVNDKVRICAGLYPDYEGACTDPFVMASGNATTQTIELARRMRYPGRVVLAGELRGGRLFSVAIEGSLKEAVPVNADGAFVLGKEPRSGDYFVLASVSHPLAAFRPTKLDPTAELILENPGSVSQTLTISLAPSLGRRQVGLEIDGMVVPTRALFHHQSTRGRSDVVAPGEELVIDAILSRIDLAIYSMPPVADRPPSWNGQDPIDSPSIRPTLPRFQSHGGRILVDR